MKYLWQAPDGFYLFQDENKNIIPTFDIEGKRRAVYICNY